MGVRIIKPFFSGLQPPVGAGEVGKLLLLNVFAHSVVEYRLTIALRKRIR